MVKVSVKWGKENLDVEFEPSAGFEAFQAQLFSLTNVPPDRQKVLMKGKKISDNASLETVKEDAKLMLMGTADDKVVKAPESKTVFVEDLTDEQKGIFKAHEGAGLNNLGNTCYMNSTLQVLRHVPELKDALDKFRRGGRGNSMGHALTAAMGQLFKDLDASDTAVTPAVFTQMFRTLFPQFNEQSEGRHMQQDADECWTQLVSLMAQHLKDVPAGSGATDVADLVFGGEMKKEMVCDEIPNDKGKTEIVKFNKLACNITGDINYMSEGIKLGLTEKIEKNSPELGRPAVYTRTNRITRLPKYLTIQFVRFFYKAKEKQKAKILRKCVFPAKFDILDFCDTDLKRSLTQARKELVAAQEKALGLKTVLKDKESEEKNKKQKTGDEGKDDQKGEAVAMELDEKEVLPTDTSGNYEIVGVVTHQGRSADSGHYVGWCRQEGDKWFKFDDDKVTVQKTEDVLALSGGGDWHMGYITLWRRIDDIKEKREKEAKGDAAAPSK